MRETVQFSLTKVSGNRKTGPIATSMTSSNSCPDSCALKGEGCYARFGMVGMHWRKVDKQGMSLESFLRGLMALPNESMFRHNVAGDLPDAETLQAITQASKHLLGFTYTHRYDESMRAAISEANRQGFTVNLSGNNTKQADALVSLNIGPVVCLIEPGTPNTSKTPSGHTVVRCPAEYIDSMQCSKCKLCARANRSTIIGFTAHGSGKNKAIITIKDISRGA